MISWWEGQDVCESHGGYLAEVKTENQQTFLVRKFLKEIIIHVIHIKENLAKMLEDFMEPTSWFIGLTGFCHEGRYQKYIFSVGQSCK